MKTRNAFLLSLFLLSNLHVFPHGIVSFNNLPAPPEGRIYRGEWVWSGSQPVFVSWVPCSGPTYRVALYWGAAGATADFSFVQVGASAGFLTGNNAGIFLGGNRTITSDIGGPVLSFQVRAWDSGPTGATTWEQALATSGVAGKGPIMQIDTKDPAIAIELPPTLGRDPAWRGFIFGADGVTTILVPEPSTSVLALLGAATLFLLRRRKTFL